METQKSAEYRKNIDEQIEIIRSYISGFELFVPKDESALGEISDLIAAMVQRVKDADDARLKRKRLMDELNRAYVELEESHKRFAEKVNASPQE